jgi:hypothetical protein
MNFRARWGFRIAVAGLASFLGFCGGNSPAKPTTHPTPTPIAAPTPTPVPTTVAPLSQTCDRLGFGSQNVKCGLETPSFLNDIQTAINQVRQQRPDVFDPHDFNQVTNTGPFYVQLIKNLDAAGICAFFDGAELGVKNNNDFNDQYEVTSSKSIIRQLPMSYQSTCHPASIPLPAPPPVLTPGCPLRPSECIVCDDRPSPNFYPLVEAAIQKLLTEQPQLFDFTDVKGDGTWPRVVNMAGYTNGVAQNLTSQGLCARFDGKEMAVKSTDDFNEQYAILLSDTWVRRGSGIYRGQCTPSCF